MGDVRDRIRRALTFGLPILLACSTPTYSLVRIQSAPPPEMGREGPSSRVRRTERPTRLAQAKRAGRAVLVAWKEGRVELCGRDFGELAIVDRSGLLAEEPLNVLDRDHVLAETPEAAQQFLDIALVGKPFSVEGERGTWIEMICLLNFSRGPRKPKPRGAPSLHNELPTVFYYYYIGWMADGSVVLLRYGPPRRTGLGGPSGARGAPTI